MVQNLQSSAEQAIEAYEYNDDLTLKDVDYINVNDLGNITYEMTYNDHFKQEIYEESSGVHIPIEIYEGCKFFHLVLHFTAALF